MFISFWVIFENRKNALRFLNFDIEKIYDYKIKYYGEIDVYFTVDCSSFSEDQTTYIIEYFAVMCKSHNGYINSVTK